ncbi:hypothetical protein [Streptomyces finlayi]|uniref:hypothetical protein n=1 Tax=Streptomyces finlayi TaxID=67296 RepID=UPI0016274B23|nr:hypothetical protein [Streptomyces finlayi]
MESSDPVKGQLADGAVGVGVTREHPPGLSEALRRLGNGCVAPIARTVYSRNVTNRRFRLGRPG